MNADFSKQVVTIPGMESLEECQESIATHAINMSKDVSSTLVNKNRITSLRSLLDLMEEYNDQIIDLEFKAYKDKRS